MQVHYEDMCQDLRKVKLGLDDLGFLVRQLTTETWGSLQRAEHMAALHSLVMEQVTPAALLEAVTPVVLAAFDAEFKKNSGTVSDLKPNRFSGLRVLLMSELLPLRLEQAVKTAALAIIMMVHGLLAELYTAAHDSTHSPGIGGDATTASIAKVLTLCRGCLISHLVAALKAKSIVSPTDFELVEDAAVRAQRVELNTTLQAVCHAASKMSMIEGALDASEMYL